MINLTNPRQTTVEELSTLWDQERRINHISFIFPIKNAQDITDIKAFCDNFVSLNNQSSFGNLAPWSHKYDYVGPEYDSSLRELTVSFTALGDTITITSDEYTPCFQIYRLARNISKAAQASNLELPEPYICRVPPVNTINHRLDIVNS